MMRWNAGLAAIALLAAGLAGCRQQCFMSEEDYAGVTNNANLVPPNLCSDLHQSIVPAQGLRPSRWTSTT